MLFVFHVDTGRMMTFDMNLALEHVKFLKETIERHHAISAMSIVLLVSGGEMLQNDARVCSYTAGTDTNPIYMFSTSTSEIKKEKQCEDFGMTETEIHGQLDRCVQLPATYSTVVARAQFALQIYEMSREELRVCKILVHEQHLQQQGWAAVVANMEDLTDEFRERCDDFYRSFNEHLERHEEYLAFLMNFDEDLDKLAEIPILSPLAENATSQPFGGFDEVYAENNDSFCKTKISTSNTNEATTNTDSTLISCDEVLSERDKNKGLTLLEWISASENQRSLKIMADSCRKGLASFDQSVMRNLKEDIEKSIDAAQRNDMKDIKGLEDRLYGLEKMMNDSKKLVQDQNELAQSFQQNQNRANVLGDASILPDLCVSHKSQLLVMITNYKVLRDTRKRCLRAKEELGTNLFQRLKFIILVENKMSELDSSLLFYHRCLRRLQKHLGIIEQIHQAPCMYVTAVTEVVRRRMFSKTFLKWASELSRRLLTIYKDEVTRRQQFATVFEGQFICALFPGMDDLPSTYALEPPSIFDTSLPALNKDDIKELSKVLPTLTDEIHVRDLDYMIEFFSSKSGRKAISAINYERGFESESDTEEFETVVQNTKNNEAHIETCEMSTSTELITKKNIETLTEDNLGSTRIEVETLKNILKNMFRLSKDSMVVLKKQLESFKAQTQSEKHSFQMNIEGLQKTWAHILNESQNQGREAIQRLTVDHELEMNDLKKSVLSKDEENQSLRCDNATLKATHIDMVSCYENEKKQLNKSLNEFQTKIQSLEKIISDFDIDRKSAIRDAVDQLEHKHKTDMESLRCRFKLMTSMDRSPSDTSLEKIERPDMIDIASHEHMLMLAKQNFTREKEIAIKNAIETEKHRWETHQTQVSCSPKSSINTQQDFFKRILEEKDKQLEYLREREINLIRENHKYKETIQSLIDPDVAEGQAAVKDVMQVSEKFESLEKEKLRLEKKLEKEKYKNNNSSVSITSCAKGDPVIIVWNNNYEQYVVVQNAPVLYFLHAESYAAFNLMPPSPNVIPKIMHCIGVVIEKDYCHARKDENRYKVSRGTRFYRVKVRPRFPTKDMESDSCGHKKEKPLNRSTVKSSQPSGMLIDSFAQTENVFDKNTVKSTISRDMIDSGVAEQQKSVYKERNISVTDEDDSTYLLAEEDRLRSKNVSEDALLSCIEADEDEKNPNSDKFKEDINESDEYRSLETRDDDDVLNCML